MLIRNPCINFSSNPLLLSSLSSNRSVELIPQFPAINCNLSVGQSPPKRNNERISALIRDDIQQEAESLPPVNGDFGDTGIVDQLQEGLEGQGLSVTEDLDERRPNNGGISSRNVPVEAVSSSPASYFNNLQRIEASEFPEASSGGDKKLLPDASEESAFSEGLVPAELLRGKSPIGVPNWIQNELGPWLLDVVAFRAQENPAMTPTEMPAWQGNSEEVLMGWAIVEQDVRYLETVAGALRWWVDSWRLPLQLKYDHEASAAYFSRRPHLLAFRLFQVSISLGSMAVSLFRDNRAAKRTEQQGWTLDSENITKRRISTAVKLKNTLVRLGPTFIKVAQSLSARPDIIGPETAKVLSELQDRLPPFPTEQAMAVIEEDLGKPLTELFTHISPSPVAAASFGQVYRGRTVDGEEVAVKVQRPGVLHSVSRDILILRILLGWVRQLAKINSDVRVLADELGRGLYGELDYRLEANNALIFAEAHLHLPTVEVPAVRTDMTSRRVLTMQWMAGDRSSDLLEIAEGSRQLYTDQERHLARQKLMRMVAIGVESSLVQLLDTGVMHADPHPGNLLLTPEGHLAYLDFGLLTRMESSHQSAMLAAIAHLVNAEWAPLANDLADMDVLKPTVDRAAVTRALEDAFGTGQEAVVKGGIPDIKFGQVTSQLWQIALRFRFKLPPYYTLVLRSLASLEGIGLAVDPEFKVFSAAYPYVVKRLLTDNRAASRKVLRELLLTEGGRFRWDRLVALTASSRQADRAKKAALLPWPVGSLLLGKYSKSVNETKSTSTALMELVLSMEASSARRVLLDADVEALSQAFISLEAKPVRERLAMALANTSSLSLNQISSSSLLSEQNEESLGARLKSMATARVQNKRLRFLVKTMIRRLKGNFFLKVRVLWMVLGVLVTALVLRAMATISIMSQKFKYSFVGRSKPKTNFV